MLLIIKYLFFKLKKKRETCPFLEKFMLNGEERDFFSPAFILSNNLILFPHLIFHFALVLELQLLGISRAIRYTARTTSAALFLFQNYYRWQLVNEILSFGFFFLTLQSYFHSLMEPDPHLKSEVSVLEGILEMIIL